MTSLKRQYIESANMLGYDIDFTKLNTYDPNRKKIIQEIADRYCDSTNDFERSNCMAALILVMWAEIAKIQNKVKATNLYDFDDCAQHLYLCIQVAMDYRAWKDGSTTAEACMRSAIASRGASAILYESNLDKNKANSNSMSLDDMAGEDEDGNTWLDKVQATEDDMSESELAAIQVVQYFIDKNKLVESIMLDNIAFNNCTKTTKEDKLVIDEDGNEIKEVSNYREFSQLALVKILNNLPADYEQRFLKKYRVAEEALKLAINKIKITPNQKLYKMIEKTLDLLRGNAGLLGM